MSLSSWIVIGAAGSATLLLMLYVFILLPRQLEQRYRESLRAFATAIELRFPRTRGATDEVVELAAGVARRMRLSTSERRDLEMAANLRDIGLCAIPYRLINRDGPLDPDEQAIYDRHPEIGAAMLELVPSLQHVAPIVRAHHSTNPRGHRLAGILSVTTEFVRTRRTEGDGAAFRLLGERLDTDYDSEVVRALGAGVSSPRAD